MTATETTAIPGPAAGPLAAVQVEHLDVSYRVRGHDQLALRDVSFQIGRNESYGLVGESGSGKSTVALALTGYLPRNGRVSAGSIRIAGRDPLAMNATELRHLRAQSVSMVYQEPGKALNPAIRVGRQVAEVYEVAGLGRTEALERSEAMLGKVQIPDPGQVMQRYPHQLSGGMAQRAVIAQMCDRVGVLYAGELIEEGPARQVFDQPRHPYTMGLVRCIPRLGQRKDHGRLDAIPGFLPPPGQKLVGCIFAPRCPIAEQRCRDAAPPAFEAGPGQTSRCYLHEATPDLPRSTPVDVQLSSSPAAAQPVVTIRNLSKTFTSRGQAVHALAGVNLDIERGETLGLVGESGSGKTTLARLLLGLIPPDTGSAIDMNGERLSADLRRRSQSQLKALQIVFQNPDSALNRRHTVRQLISRPLAKLAGLAGAALDERLTDLVRSVRMEPRHLPLRPRQLSGGLKQRVAIARAFGGPRIVVCDEPTSALDVSVQAAILNLLADLQAKEQVTYLFISHDLGLVRYLSDRIAVLYLGRLMELGPAERVFSGPHHPYTEALLSAVPSLDGRRTERIRLTGEIPSPANPPSGCVFHTRCPRRLPSGVCESTEPPLTEVEPGHLMSCHIPIGQLTTLQSNERMS
jgi:peptide/nickel transport system ATP-binding protein